MIQLQGVVIICLWTFAFSWLALKVTGLITPIRVDEQSEFEGLDITEHNETGYHAS
jgi:Amt family ammonium transporter